MTRSAGADSPFYRSPARVERVNAQHPPGRHTFGGEPAGGHWGR